MTAPHPESSTRDTVDTADTHPQESAPSPAQPDWSEYYAKRLEAYQASFKATKNGAWAWMAINLCLRGEMPYRPDLPAPPPLPFPDWVQEYLKEAAAFVYDVGMPKGMLNRSPAQEIANTKAPGFMLKALKMKGPAQFREFAGDMEAYQMALLVHVNGGDKARAVSLAKESASDHASARKDVKRKLARGQERFSYLGRDKK